jgi:hypothetical protein
VARTRPIRSLLAVALAACIWASGAAAQPVALAPPATIDGPDSAIQSLGGVAVARDGTGGLVYLKAGHVFVARLLGGSFTAPEQVDANLAAPSTTPVIAADDRGVLLVAFVNAGELYVVDRPGSSATFTAPQPLASGAATPAISMSDFGKAYVAFTVTGGGGHDVRTAYYYAGHWSLEPQPLDANPADDAGSGEDRPAVATAGDGVAIVAWGEAGHVFTRRVWGTSPSVVFEQADVPSYSGFSELTADQPTIGAGGNSSYADVAFREQLTNGVLEQSRVLVRRLRGSQYDAISGGDGLGTPGIDAAAQPRLASDEFGEGMLTSERVGSNQVFAMRFGNNGAFVGTTRVDSQAKVSPPHAVPAQAGYHDNLVAWQQDPGSAGPPEIRVRLYDGSSFGPELVASDPAAGPTDAASGLDAAGDISADVAVAWIQGTGEGTSLFAAQLFEPPGAPSPQGFHYVRTAQPVLVWSRAREPWPPVQYVVALDGDEIAQTTALSVVSPPLSDGPHSWSVSAVNRAGLSSGPRGANLWVDTIAPSLQFTLSGKRLAGAPIHLRAAYTDSPPPEPPGAASGISSVIVRWGDGTSTVITGGKYHVYHRAGTFTITVIATDHAGNATTSSQVIQIKPKPKRKHKVGRKHR